MIMEHMAKGAPWDGVDRRRPDMQDRRKGPRSFIPNSKDRRVGPSHTRMDEPGYWPKSGLKPTKEE